MSDETEWDSYRPVVPDGTYLARSRGPDGEYRALLFDIATGKLVGPPELAKQDKEEYEYEPVALSDEDESVSLGELIASVIVVAGTVGVVKAAPHIKSWLQEKAFPSLKRKWARKEDLALSATDEGRSQATIAELATLSKTAPADFSKAIDVALEDCRTSMSSEEALGRLAAMLAAAAFIAEQVRMLSNARFEDDADFPELKSTMEKLTTQQVTDSINRMLETNSSLLEEETSIGLMRVFGGGRVVDGEYVPLRTEKIKDALRLTDGEM
ncbi:MAG: hypothetical protein ACR2MB_05870 [Acidimicrobiales bacterium]